MSLSGWAKAIRSNGGSASSLRMSSKMASVGPRKKNGGAGNAGAKASGNAASGSRGKSRKVERRGRKSDRGYPSISPAEKARWQAESDMSVLASAAEVLKSPERVRAAQKIAKEREIAARKAAEAVIGVRATKGE